MNQIFLTEPDFLNQKTESADFHLLGKEYKQLDFVKGIIFLPYKYETFCIENCFIRLIFVSYSK